MPTLTYRPTSDGYYKQVGIIYPSSPTTHYDKVDEASSDGDTTYLREIGTTMRYDTFGISAGVIPGVVTKATIYAMCELLGGSGSCFPVFYNSAHALAGIAELPLSGSYSLYSQDFLVDPYTGVAFTPTAFQNYEIGIGLKGDNTWSAKCTQLYITIEYALPSGGQVRFIGMRM